MPDPVKSPTPDDRPSAFPWPPIILIVLITLAMLVHQNGLPLGVPFAATPAGHYVGMMILSAGCALIIWATVQFSRHQTSIRPDRGSDALLLVGPFAFSRNPIYLGEAIALFGAGMSFNRLWLILAVPAFVALVTRLAIIREETYLARRFGASYLDYMARVRRWL